jgi:hypothetical protein
MPLIVKSLLDSVCQAKPKHLAQGMKLLRQGSRVAWFKDNGSNILAVAHLDTVNPRGIMWSGEVKLDKTIFFSPYLDDRLGAYTILKVLPEAYKINLDVLFTMDEEVGASTADLFKTEKKYNWIVEFDRRGGDVVAYDYKDDALKKKLESVGFKMGWGSFTDICRLEDLGCKAFNVGVGYENEHSARPSLIVETYNEQITKFVKFYELYKDELMPHTKKVKQDWFSWKPGQVQGFGAGRAYNFQQPYLNYGGVSDEYVEWSNKRAKRETKGKPKLVDTTKKGWDKPTVFKSNGLVCHHLWCPICSTKLEDGVCRDCGKLVLTSDGWWPEQVLNDEEKAAREYDRELQAARMY